MIVKGKKIRLTKIALSLFCFFLASFIFFWHEIGTFAAKELAKKLLDVNLHFEEIFLQDGQLHFKNVTFYSKKRAAFFGSIEKLSIAFNLSNTKSWFGSELFLYRPLINIPIGEEKFVDKTSFFRKKIIIVDGKISCVDKELKLISATFQKDDQKSSGEAIFDTPQRAKLNWDYQDKVSKLELFNFELSYFVPFIAPSFQNLKSMEALEGVINASITYDHKKELFTSLNLDFSDFKFKFLEGKFCFKSLHIEREFLKNQPVHYSPLAANRDGQNVRFLGGKVKKITSGTSNLVDERNCIDRLSQPVDRNNREEMSISKPSFLSYFYEHKFRFYLDGGEVLFEKSNDKIEDIRGFLSFNPERGLYCDIKGSTTQKATDTFALFGKTSSSKKIELQLTYKKNSRAQCIIDLANREYQLKIKDFDLLPLNFLNLLSLSLPDPILDGKVNLELEGTFEKEGLKTISLNHFCIENLVSSFQGNNFFMDKLEGRCSFDAADFLHSFSTNFSFLGRAEREGKSGEIRGECAVDKGLFRNPLKLISSFPLFCGDLKVWGRLSEIKCEAYFKGKLTTLFAKSSAEELEGNVFWNEVASKGNFNATLSQKEGGSVHIKGASPTLFSLIKNKDFSSIFFEVRAKEIAIEKWENLFGAKANLHFSGKADIFLSGTPFDFDFMARGENLSFATSFFSLEAKKIGDYSAPLTDGGGDNFKGSFKNGKSNCFVSFSESKIKLLKYNLEFDACNATIIGNEKGFEVILPSTSQDTLQCVGKIYINLEDQISPSVEFIATSISTKLSSLKFLESEIDMFKDMEGWFRGEMRLCFSLFQEGMPLQFQLKGEFRELFLPIFKKLRIQNLQGDINIDSAQNSVELIGVQGLFAGEQKYKLYIPSFMKSDNKWVFDLRCEDKAWDFLRLKGELHFGDDLIVDIFNESHFYNAALEVAECRLNKAFEIISFNLKSIFNLEKGKEVIKFIEDLNLLPFANPIFENSFGNIEYKLSCTNNTWRLCGAGKNLQIKGVPIKSLKIGGEKEEKEIKLNCTFDNLKVIVDVEKKNQNWELSNFILSEQEKTIISAKKFLLLEGRKFKGEIENVQINLEELYQFFPKLENLKGEILAKGYVEGQLPLKSSDELALNMKGEIDFKQVNMNDIELKKIDNKIWDFSFSLDKGFLLKGGEVSLTSNNLKLQGDFSFLVYRLMEGRVELKGINLPIDFKQAAHLCEKRQWQELFEFSKIIFFNQKSRLVGDLIWDTQDEKLIFESDDIYLEKSKDAIECKVKYLMESTPFFIKAHFGLTFPMIGSITLDDAISATPLTIHCQLQEDEILCDGIIGSFFGFEGSFYKSGSPIEKDNLLLGSLNCDFSKSAHLFSEKFSSILHRFKIGKGYEVLGVLKIPKKEIQNSSFEGTVIGKNFEFDGYYLKTLFAKIIANKEEVQVSDIKMSDSSGTLSVPKLTFENKESWEISMPFLHLKDFRPSLLRDKIGKENEVKPLLVKEFKFFDLKGRINEEESLTGWGYFNFTNSFKKGRNILDLPADVLGRLIGLDLELLIPVNGRAELELKGGKFWLNKINDFYSEGGRSKFLLLSSNPIVCMDLDGNLTLDIGMKQYVLFKLTEKFIISIRGTLDKPTIRLKKKRGIIAEL